MKLNTTVAFLLFIGVSFCTRAGELTDTSVVKQYIDRILREKPPVPREDSLLDLSLSICRNTKLPSWEIRLLNFWSQQKVSQADYATADALISKALNICEHSRDLSASVDYRDALIQKSLVLFYKGVWDSCLTVCIKGKVLSQEANDDFNESLFTAHEANIYGITQKNQARVEPLYLHALELARKTASLHDDVMMLHNYSYFLKTAPLFDLRRSLEILIDMQGYSQADELDNYRYQPYHRMPFYYRGTHLQLLQQLSEGYFYLQDFDQAIQYAGDVSRKQLATGRIKYLPYTLVYRTFLETYKGNRQSVQQLLDSTVHVYKAYHDKEEMPVPYFYYIKAWLSEQENDFFSALKYYTKACEGSGQVDVTESHIGLFRAAVKSRNLSMADSLYRIYHHRLDSNIVSYYKIFFYKELAAYYRLKHMETEALKASLRYYEIKDSMAGISTFLIASRYEKQFRLKEKDQLLLLAEKEKELNQKQLSLKNKQTLWLSIGLLALLVSLLLVVKNYRLKQEQARRLKEKNDQIETLIRELHHRVKNNLQTVSGLLSLQSNRIQDDEVRQMMEEGKSRVEAMALIHQKLYMNNELASVNIAEYLQELSHYLAGSFGYDDNVVKTQVQLPATTMDIDKAIPIGLIVNELITNAFKYAFRDTINPEISLSLIEHKAALELKVSDNGKGFTPAPTAKESFGLKLVKLLVQQLNGELSVYDNNGTTYQIIMHV